MDLAVHKELLALYRRVQTFEEPRNETVVEYVNAARAIGRYAVEDANNFLDGIGVNETVRNSLLISFPQWASFSRRSSDSLGSLTGRAQLDQPALLPIPGHQSRMPPNAVDQSLETRCEVELSFFKDTVLVYQAYERWVQAAHRYITVLSEADNDTKTVNEIVHLVAAGKKKYTSCMSVLVERGKTITLLPFVIRGIDSNSAAAQISKMFSVEMSTKGKDVPEPESAVLHQQAIEYAEAHQDRTLTTEVSFELNSEILGQVQGAAEDCSGNSSAI
ncbi:MAG: hypothetical protein M1835_007681 [Candelina submexicana]|nr:MAG: hypothetical protein M1835_007681 [Candelina submexicana]